MGSSALLPMTSLGWLELSLPGLLPALWMSLGLGIPWAYALLDARCWHSRALLAALALTLGPACMTAWALLLGMLGAQLNQHLLTAPWLLAGSLLLALLGAIIAWRKRQQRRYARPRHYPALAPEEKLLLLLLLGAVGLRWLHSAFWPFTAYDALWVYGYQGRLYFLEGNIPQSIAYYPPYLQLQFTTVQALIGAINDHAARMVLPFQHIGSILAAYLLGARLLSRRVGIFTAALWALHPHVGQWSFRADLEIPLTFSFTLAAVFFLRAWQAEQDPAARRREALIAGLMLGIAMFTKPTAGAFIWGLLLLLIVALVMARFSLRAWLPRLQVAAWMGIACVPLGGLWYARNLLLGHDVLTLPKAIWLTRALRNGDYLLPLLAIALAGYTALALLTRLQRRDIALGACGALLLSGAVLASNALLFPQRVDPPASYLRLEEVLCMLLGLACMALSLGRIRHKALDPRVTKKLALAGWALLLALPYFVTMFFSYSYHYRLGFAIMPLLCLVLALALDAIFSRVRLQRWHKHARRSLYIALLLICLPGLLAVAVDHRWSKIWLLQSELDSDHRKYQVFNPSLMEMVQGLQDYQNETARSPIVLAPGEERLPFFFPQMTIHDAPISTLAQLEQLGASHVIYGVKAREAYTAASLDPQRTQLVAALGRQRLFQQKKAHYDATFSYELYEVQDLSQRWQPPPSALHEDLAPAVFGDSLRVYADSVFPPVIHKPTPMTFEPVWQALQPIDRDLRFRLQLRGTDGEVWQEWTFPFAAQRNRHYHSSLWQPGEFIQDQVVFNMNLERYYPETQDARFWLALVDAQSQEALPLRIDGQPAGDALQLAGVHELRR